MPARSTSNRPDTKARRQYAEYLKLWQGRLNLNDWRISLSRSSAAKGAMADMAVKLTDRLATARLGDFQGHEVNDYSLESTAVHELLHVFFATLLHACREPTASDDVIATLEHSLITTLEPLLVPNLDELDADTKAE